MNHPHLFSPLSIRGITLRNRIAVSPMAQYSSEDSIANDWHLVHLGSRAVGGAGLVIMESTVIEPNGRYTPYDLGLWKEEHVPKLSQITAFIKSQGAVPGVQLAHSGRKASYQRPWDGAAFLSAEEGGWPSVGPSALAYKEGTSIPSVLDHENMKFLADSFMKAAELALQAGFEVIELQGAHGYLLHEFLSPLSNQRTDAYGGTFENRIRFPLEVIQAVRKVWPERLPLFVRLSVTDWIEGGWSEDDSVALAPYFKEHGVDLIDCSSGGIVPQAPIPVAPGYQLGFATRIKKETGLLAGSVGLITAPDDANQIIVREQADLVFLGRELLRNPYWPLHAAKVLKQKVTPPVQYKKAFE